MTATKEQIINLIIGCDKCGHRGTSKTDVCNPPYSGKWRPITNLGCENYLAPSDWHKSK